LCWGAGGQPGVNVHVVWTNAWYDPATESEATNSLLDIGLISSPPRATLRTRADGREAWSCGVGFNADASRFAPTNTAASAISELGAILRGGGETGDAGTWKSTDEWWPIGTGIVGLSPLGPAVTDTLKNLVEQRQQDLMVGRFDVFWGPIKDQSGKLRIATDEKPADEVLLGMNWFVDGVVGTVPK
jgi:basic membrane protein A